jgi:hypothetical protein
MVESSGESFWVTLTNDKGQTITPEMFKSWNDGLDIENNISRAEALDRALISAADWADFFGTPRPHFEEKDGSIVMPSMTLDCYLS